MNIQTAIGAFKTSPLFGTIFDDSWLSTVETYFAPGQSQPTVIGLETHFPSTTEFPQTDLSFFFSQGKLQEEIAQQWPFREIATPFEKTAVAYNGLWLEYDIQHLQLTQPSIWLSCEQRDQILAIVQSLHQQNLVPEESVSAIQNRYAQLKTDVHIGFMFSRTPYTTIILENIPSAEELFIFLKKYPAIIRFIKNMLEAFPQQINLACKFNSQQSTVVGIECESIAPEKLLQYLATFIPIHPNQVSALTQWQQTMPVIQDSVGRISHFKLLFNTQSEQLIKIKIYYGIETLKNFAHSSYFKYQARGGQI